MDERDDFETIRPHLGLEPEAWDTDAGWRRLQARMQAPVPRRTLRRSWLVAAALVVALGASLLVAQLHRAGPVAVRPAAETYRTGVGERRTLRLADGTSVELNASSALVVEELNGARRVVVLEGQAFFDVARDAQRTFTVRTATTETRVLGTAFDVNAYPGARSVEVAVARGRVEVTATRAGQSTILTPGQAARANGSLAVHTVAPADIGMWRTGQLVFRAARFAEVTAVLERWYGVQLVIADSALADARLTAQFNQQQPVDEVLALLAETLNARADRAGTRVTFHAQ